MLSLWPGSAWPQTDTTHAVITVELGEVRITAHEKDPASVLIMPVQMYEYNRKDLAGALNLLIGLNFVNVGGRNDAMITVRGFDLRQVPVYLDGIPVYVPFDGYVDLSRFLVNDLAKISVSKGISSVLYGTNTLGGAINLVTKKPVDKLDISGSTGIKTGHAGINGWLSDLNIGSRMGRFYFAAGYSILDYDSWCLSGKYIPSGAEDGDIRGNSFRKDLKWSVKAGFTPDSTDEYVITYFNQQGSKGVPVYAGSDPMQRVRYWRFPEISRQGASFISKTGIGKIGYLRTRLFYDRYGSDLRSFDDSTYATQNLRSSFTSIYFDDSFGGSAEYDFQTGNEHDLKAVIHYKNDHHLEHNTHPVNETPRHFIDHYLSFGAEENYQPSQDLLLVAGMSYNISSNVRADNYKAQSDSVFPFPASRDASLNAQFGIDYRITEQQDLRFSLARKTRFATMKDRYSYRLGRSLPNPALAPESVILGDLSYAMQAGENLQLSTSLFYSRLKNVIQEVYGIDPVNSAVYQLQNTGRAAFYGLEAGVEASISSFLQAGLQYAFLERKNLSHPDLIFTDVPRNRITGTVKFFKKDRFHILLLADYNSERPSTSDGLFVAKPFITCQLTSALRIWKFLSLESGIMNLFDASYYYSEGYPEEGRNIFISIRYSL
jgi:iron complex outermembrane receptor protein